jgi:hypothetical protein
VTRIDGVGVVVAWFPVLLRERAGTVLAFALAFKALDFILLGPWQSSPGRYGRIAPQPLGLSQNQAGCIGMTPLSSRPQTVAPPAERCIRKAVNERCLTSSPVGLADATAEDEPRERPGYGIC